MKRLTLITIFVLGILILAACSSSSPETPTPTPTPVPISEAVETEDNDLSPEAAAGLETFRTVGCAGCHGQNGEGMVGPALAGHTREQVFRQVRTPAGDIMPPFLEDRLSDADIENIVAWIDTLGEDMVMEHSDEDTGDAPELSMTESDHLRLILDSLAVDNVDDAIHHAQHLAEDANPEVLPLAEKLLADLNAGEVHTVEVETRDVLGSLADAEFDSVAVHLGMALSAAQRDDEADVGHHLESAVVASASHSHQAEMQQLLTDWQQGDDQHDVIDRIYDALGLDHQD